MSAPPQLPFDRPLAGHWAGLWDHGHLDLLEPAMMTIGADGHGEIAFGALQAGLDLGYNQSIVHFTWMGHAEMEEVIGDGYAELLGDGTIRIAFAHNNGDEVILNAKPETFSTTC